LLESRRDGRRALYVLTERGRKRFITAQRRIYMPPAQAWNGVWTLVLTSRTGNSDVDRTELRRELAWLGFAAIGQGILAHPAADLTALREVLETQELLDKVHVLQASDVSYFGALPTREIAARAWNLDSVAESYRHFVELFRPLQDRIGPDPAIAPLQAFRLRTLLVHAYRRAILQDPLFPAELLPQDWPGKAAYKICSELYNLCCRSAEDHLSLALGIDTEKPQPAEPYFYLRFGGLVI
jgi:phenylacetic acid degradation operon negative regulatory protein